MAQTTGPVLATGGIVMLNRSVFNGKPFDWRILAATAFATGFFAIVEKPFPKAAEALAWTALVAVLFTRVQPDVKAPAESFLTWWNKT